MKEGRFLTEKDEAEGGPRRRRLHYKAADAVLEAQDVEVEKQANVITAHPEVCQDLGFMHWQQVFDRLDFEDEFLLNDDIGPKSGLKRNTFVNDGHRNLAGESDSRLMEFEAEALLINRFQQSWPQAPMQLDRKSDHRPGQLCTDKHILPQWPSICLVLLRVEP
jgi:hypothetical protein